MLSRRYLATAVLASSLAVAAVPAVAAADTPAPTPGPLPTKVIKAPNGLPCVLVTTQNGRTIIKAVPAPATAVVLPARQAEACRELVKGQLALPYPKGAPQTGGGGMAAEVSSWG